MQWIVAARDSITPVEIEVPLHGIEFLYDAGHPFLVFGFHRADPEAGHGIIIPEFARNLVSKK